MALLHEAFPRDQSLSLEQRATPASSSQSIAQWTAPGQLLPSASVHERPEDRKAVAAGRKGRRQARKGRKATRTISRTEFDSAAAEPSPQDIIAAAVPMNEQDFPAGQSNLVEEEESYPAPASPGGAGAALRGISKWTSAGQSIPLMSIHGRLGGRPPAKV